MWKWLSRWRKKDEPGRTSWTEWEERIKNSRFKLPEITEQNEIIITFAERRRGKSVDDVADGIASMERGEINAFNYDVHLPPWIDPKYYIRYTKIEEVMFRPRIRIHMDEGTRDFHCHNWSLTPDSVKEWLSELGKYMQCLRIIVQVAKQMDPSFRDQATTIYLLRRSWRVIHKTKYVRHINNPNLIPPWDQETPLENIWNWRKRFRYMHQWLFACFNSYQHFKGRKKMSRKEMEKEILAEYEKRAIGVKDLTLKELAIQLTEVPKTTQ